MHADPRDAQALLDQARRVGQHGLRCAAMAVRDTKETQMRFMILVKATADSEAGVMPAESLFAEMGAFVKATTERV